KAYRGFVEVQKEILQTIFPSLTNIELNTQSERQSTYLMKFFQANVREIQRTVKEYDIKADISMNGWLRIAESAEEEKGLLAEIEFAKKKLGLEFEHWSPEKIMKETGIHTKYGGRFIKESGNYNPFKYVIEVLKAAIQKGVKLYTSTKVESVQKLQDGTYLVKTNKGDIITKKILAASNVTTRSIFKNMEFIEPRVSHVLSTEHTVNQWKGITVTRQQGDWYGHFPKQSHYIGEDGVARAVFHNGGGFDTPVDYSVVENPPADLHPFSKDIYNEIKANAAVSVPDTKGRPGSRFWWGFMAFTKDRMPIVSFLFENGKLDKNIVVVMADNGYGGSQAAISGKYGVQMLITGEIPKELPDDIFSLKRFYTKIPLFKKGSHCRTVHF
ncbi:MAG: NAD(P)/FAD-dependent oxidoreductase, partial [Pseudobdellovibrionaceae bacterium]